MSVISFASSKGGACKTTGAIICATTIAKMGRSVALIDTDPNQHSSFWSSISGPPDNLVVIEDVKEGNINEVIEYQKTQHPFVIVDLEGTASATTVFAINESDLVILPLQPSGLDKKEANKILKLMQVTGYQGQYRVLFSRTKNAIITKHQKRTHQELLDKGVEVLTTQLYERAAFSALFDYGGTLYDLKRNEVSNPEAAIENAEALVSEIVDVLRSAKENHG